MKPPERYSPSSPAARPQCAVAAHARMALRPLLRQLATDPNGAALARNGGRAFVSASLRPYLVAGLLDGVDDAIASGKPALGVGVGEEEEKELTA
jgi:transcription-repair coupling factor (superfamily II helicase)